MSIRMLALCGSLRRDSWNRKLLLHAQKIGVTLEADIRLAEIGELPHYSQDLQSQGFPTIVTALGDKIRQADAVLIASPEYNYSVPGVLKNAIDWLSRLPEAPLAGKPTALMGASPGLIGTARMQYHLRQILLCLDADTVSKPEVMIGQCSEKFSADGALTDSKAREMVERLLRALIAKAT